MIEPWKYLSVLKGLQAEYGALVALEPPESATVTALVQLWHRLPKPDANDQTPGSDIDANSEQGELFGMPRGEAVWRRLSGQLLSKVKDKWDPDRPVLLDGEWLEDAVAYETVLDNCRMSGRRPLPVTGLGRAEAYQAVISRAVRADGGGVVLRLGRDDFRGRAPNEVKELINGWLASLGLRPDEVDVVLDLRSIEKLFRERDELFAEAMLRTLPHLHDWRNLALVGSGIPVNAKGFQADDITPFARPEWWLWLALRQRLKVIGRIPVFGDYGVIHPDRVEAIGNTKAYSRIPAILYTSHDDYLMVRGRDLNRGWTTADERRLFQRLLDGPDWCGPTFSKGDEWIADVALGRDGPGGWMTWKRTGECHHWTYVSRQLANQLDF